LTVTNVTPTVGTAVINPDNTVTYTPPSGFSGTDTFVYTISDGNGGSDAATVTVEVQWPTLVAAYVAWNASEDGQVGEFVVFRSGDASGPLTVTYAVGGDAGSGDYQPLSGVVTIPANETHVSVFVTPINDAIAEEVETVVLDVNAGAGYTVDTAWPIAVMDLYDNEGLVGIFVSQNSSEDGTVGEFVVYRTGDLTYDLAVSYSVGGSADSSDYVPLTGSVTIPAGDSQASIFVTAIDDAEVEGTDTIEVTLNSGPGYTIDAAAASATMDLYDDDPESFGSLPLSTSSPWNAGSNSSQSNESVGSQSAWPTPDDSASAPGTAPAPLASALAEAAVDAFFALAAEEWTSATIAM
jgi:hypothetical protein